ncbi:hypothetical protein O3G_MSEX014374 [Manduca sexta]|uniref:Uncharacterized protein n=1 Tax=Manduca sexta TaxID=7130 RepID=A0A921ZUJ1_MANSE|nr:hypothetical protein O3G_MSEX014374 [Manduca sexta]
MSVFAITHTPSRILSPKGYAKVQPGHQLFAKCVPSQDVIGGEPIAISGTNSRLWTDIEQKNPIITLPDPGFEPQDLRALPYRACSTTTPPRQSLQLRAFMISYVYANVRH